MHSSGNVMVFRCLDDQNPMTFRPDVMGPVAAVVAQAFRLRLTSDPARWRGQEHRLLTRQRQEAFRGIDEVVVVVVAEVDLDPLIRP